MTLDSEDRSQPSFARMHNLYWSFAPTFMVHAGVKVGLFDALEKQSRDAADLARTTSTSLRGITRLADGLVGLGLLKRDAQGRYGLTPDSSTFLLSSKPATDWGRMFRSIDEEIVADWQHLAASVRTGKPPRAHNVEDQGGEFFAEAVEGMVPMSWSASEALARHFAATLDTRKPIKVLDVAAGSGVWGVPQAIHIPQVHVTAVDWPQVLEVTKRMATRYGVADRYTFVAGDLDSVDFGSGYYYATLGHIVHAIGEKRSRVLMEKTFAALAPGGTIVVPEFIMDEDRAGPPTSVYFGMSMIVQSQDGAAFSLSELTQWLNEAGFVHVRLLDAPAPSPLILATKPS